MAGRNQKKAAKRQQGERVVPNNENGSSRVSSAAGTSFHASNGQQVQSVQVEQRSNVSPAKRSAGGRSTTTKTRSKASGGKKGSSSRRPTPASSTPDPRDTQFIRWAHGKWRGMEPHHQRGVFGLLLLVISLLLFGTLTVFRTSLILAPVDSFFLNFFGWAAYPLVLGLVAFALARLVEGVRGQHFLSWRIVIGLFLILLLLLAESRLIFGPVGILAELLVYPLAGWSSAVRHVVVLGLLLIVTIFTFRLTFGHILRLWDWWMHLISDDPRAASRTPAVAASPYLGQRPQYSRYGGAAGAPVAPRAGGGVQLAHTPRRSSTEEEAAIEEDDDEFVDDEDATIAFEADFPEDDPLNDINIHKQQIGTVPRGPRVPAGGPPDPVRAANQQSLPFDENAEKQKLVLKRSNKEADAGMEPLQPNPRLAANQAKAQAASPALPNIVSPWKVPDTTLLNNPDDVKLQMLGDDTSTLARTIQETLRSFRVDAEVRPEDISIGPTVIRFGIRPTGKPEMKQDEKIGKMVPVKDAAGNIIYEVRTRVSRIMALQNDLALVLEAKNIRMEAPVPGRPYVGVEIPNKNSRLVTLREVLESKEYQASKAKSKLSVALGRDVAGLVRIGDLARMPHLLIAGATGAGKCLAYDEPVFLADGRVAKVQQLVGQTVQVIGVTDTNTMQQVPVPATFTENGVQDVFEIELDNGVIIRRTGEHPLWSAALNENQHVGRQPNGKAIRRTRAINAGWVQAKDLRVCGNRPDFDGHVILCPLSLQQQGTVAKSDADVILCAALIAEGGLNRYDYLTYMRTPRFTNADPLMVEQVRRAVEEYGCKLVLSTSKSKELIDYYISQPSRKGRGLGNPVAHLIRNWEIDCLATQKIIPSWVFQLPDEQIALFLRVFIDCDGWFDATTDRTAGVNITLANPILIQQIGQLALRLGITGTYRYRDNGYAGAWLWFSRMVDMWQKRVSSTVKAEKLARSVSELERSRTNAATEWNAWRKARPLPDQKFADCPQGYEWRKIVAIQHTTVPTVNIEVHSENHAFVGYAVEHNSVCINTIIASVLTQATPDDVRMLMVDPKMVELNMYNGIPHLLSPVVIDVDKVVSLLKNAINEMERRYRLFSQLGVRNLDGYRKMRMERIAKGDTSLANMPAIVIIIDELADLMMAAPEEVEGMICRLAQLARATGIHLVIATQRPSVDVITGLIKANIPTRISFMVSSAVDSRTIIDMGGAERLLGRGDMLYLPADAGRPERIQCSFLADEEAERLVHYWQQQIIEHAQVVSDSGQEVALESTRPVVEPGWEVREENSDDFELDDDLLDKAEEIVREYGRASISLLQRRLRIGYSRAARLIDLLEEHGIIGHFEAGGRAREVLEGGGGDEGRTLADEVDDIVAEEKARNDFLRKQAEGRRSPAPRNPPVEDGDDEDE